MVWLDQFLVTQTFCCWAYLYQKVTGESAELSVLAFNGKQGDSSKKQTNKKPQKPNPKNPQQHAGTTPKVFGKALEVARVTSQLRGSVRRGHSFGLCQKFLLYYKVDLFVMVSSSVPRSCAASVLSQPTILRHIVYQVFDLEFSMSLPECLRF